MQWTVPAEKAFCELKALLSDKPILHSPDFEKSFVLQTDASELGLGAVLMQEENGGRHPVVYLSWKLFPRETRYSVVEKECLALKWALDSLKYYLLGRDFVIKMDHKVLEWLNRMKDTNSQFDTMVFVYTTIPLYSEASSGGRKYSSRFSFSLTL